MFKSQQANNRGNGTFSTKSPLSRFLGSVPKIHCNSNHRLMTAPSVLSGVFHFVDSFFFLPFPPFCRVLRTLIPVTTKRAIRLSGQSPVHSAADGGQTECLQLLIQNGFDINTQLDKHISGRSDCISVCLRHHFTKTLLLENPYIWPFSSIHKKKKKKTILKVILISHTFRNYATALCCISHKTPRNKIQ